jgi:hypothetical protein
MGCIVGTIFPLVASGEFSKVAVVITHHLVVLLPLIYLSKHPSKTSRSDVIMMSRGAEMKSVTLNLNKRVDHERKNSTIAQDDGMGRPLVMML